MVLRGRGQSPAKNPTTVRNRERWILVNYAVILTLIHRVRSLLKKSSQENNPTGNENGLDLDKEALPTEQPMAAQAESLSIILFQDVSK